MRRLSGLIAAVILGVPALARSGEQAGEAGSFAKATEPSEADWRRRAPAFAAKPAAKAEGDKVRIEFAADRATDVAVEVLDEKGRVVRHLAAGLLGPNAPEPLERDKLAQALLWDRKDDDGKPVAKTCKVRVSLGLGVRYAGEYGGGYQPIEGLPWDGRNIDGLRGIAGGPDGTIYMLGGWSHPHLDRHPHLIALDRDGNFLREVYPPSAKLMPDKVTAMPTLRLADGSVIPQAGSWWDLFIPAMTGARQMVATPDGHLLLATEAPDYVTERRALLKLGADGSVPKDAYALKLPPGMATLAFSMAASPDSKTLYVSGYATTRPMTPLQAVYRLALDGSNRSELFFGEEKRPGEDDKHLKEPAGVAVDKDGNVCVADFGNNRVLVIRPDGSLLRQIKADKPFAVQVGPKSGAIYVLSVDAKMKDGIVIGRKLIKFSAEGQEIASADVLVQGQFGYGRIPMRFGGMGLDAKGEEPVVWLGCTSAPDGCNGYPYGYSYGVVKVADEGQALAKPAFIEISAPIFEARKKQRAAASHVQRDGYSYGYIMKSSGDPSVIWMTRKDAKGKEAPFPAAGDKKWAETLGRPSSRYYGLGVVNYQNDILFSYYNWLGNDDKRKYGVTCIDQFAPDGSVKKRELVYGLHEGCFATPFLVDRKGNIYVSDHIQPPGRVAPQELEAALAAAGAKPGANGTYVDTYGSIFKFPPTGGGFKWGQTGPGGAGRGDLIRNPTAVEDSAGGRVNKAACEGAEWQFFGIAPVATTRGRCMCTGSGPALDGHARLYVPDAYRMCVHVLDTNGNYLLRIGKYGNQDDAKGQIAFARPRFVKAEAGQITVTDPQNGKALKLDLVYAAEESCNLP